MDLMNYKKTNEFFNEKGYNCLSSFPIINDNDTIFVSAGIQPILKKYREGGLVNPDKLFVAQPVIRTQYANSIDEGYSIAFTNITSAGFNNSEEEYNKMIKDWYDYMEEIEIPSKKITTTTDIYEDTWDDLEISGKRTFHYYNGVELGDTTFFTKVMNDDNSLKIDSMCDLGFGLERLRWVSKKQSYFDLYSDSKELDPSVKAYLSVIALLAVNNVIPSNKSFGYRARLFSKKLVSLLEGKDLTKKENAYLDECIKYWQEWQNKEYFDKSIIINEYVRNGNRYILDLLTNEGYDNLSGININISREELNKRLLSSGVDEERVKRLVRRY